MISIAHRIELKPNNKQKTYFRKAFGCARLAYNWGLAEWKRMYEAGEKPGVFTLEMCVTKDFELYMRRYENTTWEVEEEKSEE